MIKKDTIVAIATASGTGAVAIVRLSGKKAIEITEKVFFTKKAKKLSEQKAYTIHYGEIIDNEQIIDDVLVSLFKSPHSYTGENSVEISCHGSVHIQQKILELLLRNGARLAEPGEFTLRAFLNGKLDLSQAEAVADLIASTSDASHRIAIQQIRGGFSNEISNLRNQLVNFISLIELELDFSDEDVEFADRKELKNLITEIKNHVSKLIKSFKLGNVIKNGIPVAIIGEPNVGKSTLLNLLLNEEKAIVSDIAGTTRDSIEDIISINGITFRFIDTAGIRETTDTIENLGIKRTFEKIEKAEIVLLMLDANDKNAVQKIIDIKSKTENKQLIIVVNKIDTNSDLKYFESIKKLTPIFISAKYKNNTNQLIDELLKSINYSSINKGDTIITNARHYEALQKAHISILRVIEGLKTQISGDFLAQDIREIMNYLGEISGEITDNEVLGNIFEKFCIGK